MDTLPLPEIFTACGKRYREVAILLFDRAPSFRPDLPSPTRSSERRSRMAVGHRVSGA
jgi:hypothetical protein